MRLTTYVEDLRSFLMFHLIPSKIDLENLRQKNVLETLNPPYDLRVKQYSMKVTDPSQRQSDCSQRYTRKVATTFQCSRVIGKPKTMPCNGALYVVDKVSNRILVKVDLMN